MGFFGLESLLCGEGVAKTHKIEASHTKETFVLDIMMAGILGVDDTRG
jgi:hypothetical protein